MKTATALLVLSQHLKNRRPQKATKKAPAKMADPINPLEVLALSARAREVAELDRQLRDFLPKATPSSRLEGNVFSVGIMTPDQARAFAKSRGQL
jgi:hypothetical protein